MSSLRPTKPGGLRGLSGLVSRVDALASPPTRDRQILTSAESRSRLAELTALARWRRATYCPAFPPGPHHEEQLAELRRLRAIQEQNEAEGRRWGFRPSAPLDLSDDLVTLLRDDDDQVRPRPLFGDSP